MYGCAITCSETSSSFGVSHSGLLAGLRGFEVGLPATVFGSSIVRLRFAHPASARLDVGHRTTTARCSLPRDGIHRSTARRTSAITAASAPRAAVGLPRLLQRTRAAGRRKRAEAPLQPSPTRSAAPASSPADPAGSRAGRPSIAEGNIAKFQFPFKYCRLVAPERRRNARYCVGVGLELVPQARGGADAHQLAGIETERAERAGSLDDGLQPRRY